MFRLGSITKTVTAIAILQLVEQGHFSLQTPVSDLLPTAPIDNAFHASDPVRVVHLLTHTAGFDDTHPKAFFSPVERRGHHLESSIAHPEPLVVRWRPGTSESYSNPGYVLLGAILEAHYGQPWDELVSSKVLKRQTVGLWAATVLFPALAVAGIAVSVRTWSQETGTVARWRGLLGSASALVLSLWLAGFHLSPLALWRW